MYCDSAGPIMTDEGPLLFTKKDHAYRILSNRVLTDVSLALPKTIKELAACHGIGKVKIKKYGKQILSMTTF